MSDSRKENLKLKLGNLILAIWLSTVPTAITYGSLSLHGLNICRKLNTSALVREKQEIKELCDESAWQTTREYIFLIGFFITLPTWLWIYLSVRKKRKKIK